MRDVVIIPCYERPEFTKLCLKYLSQARGIQDKEVWLCQDNHGGDKEAEILMAMFPVADYGFKLFGWERFRHIGIEGHNTYGNSHNLINALRAAYESRAERIFLVEDDIIVAPDIFEWHEEILNTAHPFVSCATSLNRSAHFQINGPQVMDERIPDPSAYKQVIGPYSSHAAAFERFGIGDFLKFVAKKNPTWQSGVEQDLLMQQFLSSSGQRSAWPVVPRAVNVGWFSYHITGRKFTGTLAEKSEEVERTIRDASRLREVSSNNVAVTPIPEQWPIRTAPLREIR